MKKVPLFNIGFNEVLIQENGIINIPLLALVFSVHPKDRTWLVRINLIFFQIDFGWVDKE